MKLIVDINDNEYENLKKAITSLQQNGVDCSAMSSTALAIVNGTQLSNPVLSHSEISGLIYVYFGGEKYEITKYAIEAVEAIKELAEDVWKKDRNKCIDCEYFSDKEYYADNSVFCFGCCFWQLYKMSA